MLNMIRKKNQVSVDVRKRMTSFPLTFVNYFSCVPKPEKKEEERVSPFSISFLYLLRHDDLARRSLLFSGCLIVSDHFPTRIPFALFFSTIIFSPSNCPYMYIYCLPSKKKKNKTQNHLLPCIPDSLFFYIG